MWNKAQDARDVRKHDVKKPQHLLHSRWQAVAAILRMRYGLITVLAILTILAIRSTRPVPGLAEEPSLETPVPPSPTPVQVTPPPTMAATSPLAPPQSDVKHEPLEVVEHWVQNQGWLLTFAGGILIWAAGSVALLALVALLIRRFRRRGRATRMPPSSASVPFLKSSDGNLYFQLDGLEGDGLIIGRGKHGVDLRIEESTPYVDTVSNRHARIYYDATYGKVIIEDLGSTNGVFINGRQAPRKNLLKDGWEVGLGNVAITYHDGESDTGPLD
jgi:hypothetical protein